MIYEYMDTPIYIHTHIHIYIYIYIYLHICMYKYIQRVCEYASMSLNEHVNIRIYEPLDN